MKRSALLAAGALACLLACHRGETGIVIEVTTDCVVPTDIDELVIRVSTSAGKQLPEMRLPLMPEQSKGLLGRHGLAPEHDPPPISTLTLEAIGVRGKQEVVRQRAVRSFINGHVMVVPLVLRKGCIGAPCAAMGLACAVKDGAPSCVDPQVEDPARAPDAGPRDSAREAPGSGTGGAFSPGTGGAGGAPSPGNVDGSSNDVGAPGAGGAPGSGGTPAGSGGMTTVPVDPGPRDAPGTGGSPGGPPEVAPPVGPEPGPPPPPDAAPDRPPDPPPLGRPGAACKVGSECQSGTCVDEVCCNRACSDRCHACRADLTGGPNGECHPTRSGHDPRDHCTEQPIASCGHDGFCDGQGGCRRRPAGTTCAPPACAGNAHVAASTCDGAGACRPPAPQECGLLLCSDRGCPSSCQSDGHCVGDAYCDGSSCRPKKDRLAPCQDARECKSGRCLEVLGLVGLVCA